MNLTWQGAAIISALFFAATDILIKRLTDLGLTAMDVVSMLGFLYGIFAVSYLIKHQNYKRFMKPVYANVFIILFVLVITHILADYFFDTALIHSPNPGYVVASLSITIVAVYLYSIFLMGKKFNIYSFLGILLIVVGIYLVTVLSGNFD